MGFFVFEGWAVRRCMPLVLAAILVMPAPSGAQAPPQPAKPAPSQTTTQSLRILPLAGNGEANDLGRRMMAPIVVQVLDQNGRPMDGAEVTFRFPESGPSAAFPNQQISQTVRTNTEGQVAATGWMANGTTGTFQVRITATRGTETGETTISMSNVTRVVEGRTKSKSRWSSKWTKIAIVAAAAGITVGIILATRDSGGGGTATATPTITATPGSPTIGGPTP